jgi:hypothetical protein
MAGRSSTKRRRRAIKVEPGGWQAVVVCRVWRRDVGLGSDAM